MHAFFKPVMIIFIAFCICFYALVQSNAIEAKTRKFISHTGLPKETTDFTFHWDRLENYIKQTPERVRVFFQQLGFK